MPCLSTGVDGLCVSLNLMFDVVVRVHVFHTASPGTKPSIRRTFESGNASRSSIRIRVPRKRFVASAQSAKHTYDPAAFIRCGTLPLSLQRKTPESWYRSTLYLYFGMQPWLLSVLHHSQRRVRNKLAFSEGDQQHKPSCPCA